MKKVNIIIGGLGGSPAAYEALRKALAEMTGLTTLVIPSLRYGEPSMPVSCRWLHHRPEALVRQAVHAAEVLVDAGYADAEVYVYAHSLGVPIALLFAANYGTSFKVKLVVALCPAGVYAENFIGLGLKIGRKAVRDLRTRTGRKYWGNSMLHYFINPWRSLREGWEACRCNLFALALKGVRIHETPVVAGLAVDDDVFSYRRTLDTMRECEIQTFLLPPGSRHSPDYRPVQTVQAIADATSSLNP